jgi:uncharacterized protein YjbI with pentapeptide repeats
MYFNLPTINKVLEMFQWNRQREILTPHEAAKLLMVTEEEFFQAFYDGDIPGNKICGQWRFSRSELLRFCGRRFNTMEGRQLFFDDKKDSETQTEQVIQAYKEGARAFFCLGAIEYGDFSNQDLSNIDFWDSSLKGVNFSGCILRGAVFAVCDLEGANFKGADLTGANFRGAIVARANFKRANLTRADFSVDLIAGADLSGAVIHQTRF